jgi:hypothetical protein
MLVVTNTNDDGAGSLRQAIEAANTHPGADRITFDIPGSGPFTIAPNSPLPAITDPVTIDAESEPGYQNTPMVEINGANAGAGANGLTIVGGGSTVQGLAIDQFAGSGIVLTGPGGNQILADNIGAGVSGTAPMGNGNDGILIAGSASNVIGGPAGSGNIISANNGSGVEVSGAGASANVILGNLIGTDASGLKALGNRGDGVVIEGAPNNTIGGSTRNVISSNHGIGVQITGSGASGDQVTGNQIGTNVSGTPRLPNRTGIEIDSALRAANTIANNQGARVTISPAWGNTWAVRMARILHPRGRSR